MIATVYLVGLILSFSYFGLRLNRSVINISIGKRVINTIISSLFWFMSIPYLILTGDLFKGQKRLDSELYDLYVDSQIDNVILSLESPPKDEEKFRIELKKSIGTFQEMIDDTIHYSYKINQNELAGLIAYRHYKHNRVDKKHSGGSPEHFVINHVDGLSHLTGPILGERITDGPVFSKCKDNKSIFKDILGFFTLDSGLTFLGAVTKGPHPFFFIIYYDGIRLKMFVPRHNNLNRDTGKQFGEDKEADMKFLTKVFGEAMDKRKIYSEYKKKINTYTILSEIESQLNFVPKKGRPPEYGWGNITFW